ncbi:MAG TPA: ATP-binding protein [Rhodoferax sp.]|nr:ATP-binding protein [Rhodoferax sp.]
MSSAQGPSGPDVTAAAVPTAAHDVTAAAVPAGGRDATLESLQRQLDQARAELQEFTYAVSHDLRAPLRHISAFALIIEEDLPDLPVDIAGHLATIRQSAHLLTQQLDGLASLSRLGLQAVHLQPTSSALLVAEVIDELVQKYPQRALQWQIAPDLPMLMADASLLRQVIANLLENACKFTKARQPAQISVSWAPLAGGLCALTVQDNGVGFLPRQAGQLFKVFARLHPVREFEGLGLGLVQCRKMMDRMGGSIRIAAVADGGCQVSLTLPMADGGVPS